jgi:integrase
MRYLNAILNFASAETINGTHLLLSNPVQILSDKRYDRSVKPKKTFIEASQLSVWVNAVNSLCTPLARDLLLLQIQTGLRDSEAKGLLWEDVDFENRLFTVRNTKNGSDLTIPLSNQLYGLLLERKNTATSGIYVFPNKSHTGPVSSIRKQKDKVIGATGIQFTHHCLRRTFASLLNKELGVDIPTISILLNHTPQGVTQKHYLTSSPKDFRTVYQQLSSIVLKNEEAVSGT